MGKALAVLFIALLCSGLGWCSAQKQLGQTYAACMEELEMDKRLREARTADQVRLFQVQVVDCVDRRKTPLGAMVFDRAAALAAIEAAYRSGEYDKLEELMQFNQEISNLQSDEEAARSQRSFQEGAWRGGQR